MMQKKIKKYIQRIMAAVLLVMGGCFYFYSFGEDDGSFGLSTTVLQEQEASKTRAEEEMSTQPVCCVFVCGAVEAPGVYMLPEGSRIYQAVEAAGGVAKEADTASLNLAKPVTDGMRIYVPAAGEEKEAEDSGLLNINTAGREELMRLPGIGESRAKDIIDYREKHGAFAAAEEIMEVPGIKEGAFAKIKDYITV